MTKRRITCILHKWFPPDNPTSGSLARLAILREDLHLELKGIAARRLKSIDSNGEMWRKLYFLRNTFRTLWEIKSAISALRGNKEFRRTLRAHNPALFNAFLKSIGKFDRSYNQLTELRHALGGHVSKQRIQQVLDEVTPDVEADIEISDEYLETRFLFAEDLCASMILGKVDPHSAERYVTRIFALQVEALQLIDWIFHVHMAQNKLLEALTIPSG